MKSYNCSECKKRIGKIHRYKDNIICFNCLKKHRHRISTTQSTKKYTLESALNKIYKVNGYITKKGTLVCQLSVPSVLYNKQFKIYLVDEK